VSDIDTAVVDGLKALDPKRPIREADIVRTVVKMCGCQPRHASLNRRRTAQRPRQLGDVGGDAPGFVAGELAPLQRLPARPKSVLSHKAKQRLGKGETMRRREFIALMGASVTLPFAAMAQEPGRSYRLGCLFPAPRGSAEDAWFDKLRRRGFIEGQNLTVEYRAYAQHVDLIPQYAAELVKARVDVIAATGDETVREDSTKTIPIVALVGDMLGSGLVTSLARPDGNTTGVSILVYEADGKRQDILIEAVPGLRLMAVLTDVNYTSAAKLDELEKAARAHGIEFSIHRVARAEEIAAAMDGAQALVPQR
jgi:hypothetical protein